MNVHKHARLTPAGREVMVRRVLHEGQPVAVVAAGLGVSCRTVYKWVRRYWSEGEESLLDRSSRPHSSPNALRRSRIEQIARLRRRRLSSTRIARELGLPIATVGLVLRRLGLNRLSALDPPRPIVRYERSCPGELLHLDIKKLGRFYRRGFFVTGDRRGRSKGAGWEYLHVCIDDASRLAYSEILPDQRGPSAANFLRRACRWFEAQGVQLRDVMTDNGPGYTSRAFARALQQYGLHHIRTRPYTPRTNGKAERFIQTCLREWVYSRTYENSRQRLAGLAPWLRFYNCERPHMGIRGRSPQLRLAELLNNVLSNYT